MRWTSQDIQTAVQMRKEMKSFREIAEALGRKDPDPISKFLRRLNLGQENERNRDNGRSTHEEIVRAPDEVLAEREQRLGEPRTLGMLLFGDPIVPRWMSNA